VILTVWGPFFINFVKLSRPGGVSPIYIPSIYTEHAGGDDQIVIDPVLWVDFPVGVSVVRGDMNIVAVEVTPCVWAGIPRNVIVGGAAISDGDEYWIHPEQLIKKMIIPARIIQEINEFME
jgi:hypothetical protein